MTGIDNTWGQRATLAVERVIVLLGLVCGFCLVGLLASGAAHAEDIPAGSAIEPPPDAGGDTSYVDVSSGAVGVAEALGDEPSTGSAAGEPPSVPEGDPVQEPPGGETAAESAGPLTELSSSLPVGPPGVDADTISSPIENAVPTVPDTTGATALLPTVPDTISTIEAAVPTVPDTTASTVRAVPDTAGPTIETPVPTHVVSSPAIETTTRYPVPPEREVDGSARRTADEHRIAAVSRPAPDAGVPSPAADVRVEPALVSLQTSGGPASVADSRHDHRPSQRDWNTPALNGPSDTGPMNFLASSSEFSASVGSGGSSALPPAGAVPSRPLLVAYIHATTVGETASCPLCPGERPG